MGKDELCAISGKQKELAIIVYWRFE